MAIINVRKDGTVIEDMTKVVVPKDIVHAVSRILNRKDGEGMCKKRVDNSKGRNISNDKTFKGMEK